MFLTLYVGIVYSAPVSVVTLHFSFEVKKKLENSCRLESNENINDIP